MSEQLQSVIKDRLKSFICIFGISFLVTLFFNSSGFIHFWNRAIYDLCIKNRVSGTEKRNPFIATIDLNDTGINVLGEQLDTRRAFADIIEVLEDSNVSVAALDFLFRTEKRSDTDFTSTVERMGYTVIAALAVEKKMMSPPYAALSKTDQDLLRRHVWNINVIEKGKIPQAGTFLLPFPALTEAAAQIAHINMEPDSDGIYRKTPLLYEWNGGFIPSLGLAAAVLHLGIDIETIELKAGEYLALPLYDNEIIRIPIDEQGRMFIPYKQTWKDDKQRLSFHTIVEAKNNDDLFSSVFNDLNGRTAIIAEISTDQKDYGPTAFEQLYPLSGVHAEVLSGILDGLENRSFIGTASLLFKLISLLLILLAAFFLVNIKKELVYHFGFLFILILYSGVTVYRWQNNAILPWFAFPVIFLSFLWITSFVNRLLKSYRDKLLMRNALSRYFPHALAERILKERKTDLTPSYKELTILFSDIAGFTKWSSDKSPETVHQFLNEYLESMAEIIFSHGGTIDKFMGDGILAFYGDPFDMPNHTEQALRSAIAMQKKVRELAEKWKPIVGIDLRIRIGINIGKVIVGNLGSKTRIEYTVIGAAVNLAQRMESNAPIGGILVTTEVHEKVKDKFTFSEKRSIEAKGYGEPIEAYVVSA